jgi:hypothetical protein
MSNFSKNSPKAEIKATFKKHHINETASNFTEAAQIAEGYNQAHKWQHRAKVVVVGSPHIRPYDPIYLDGLPNNMSGYWTVLSVKHVFGGRPANYMIELEVGTDIIGDVDDAAVTRSNTRNVQNDLANQSLTASDCSLIVSKIDVNATPLIDTTASVSTAVTSSSPIAVPSIPGTDMYAATHPNTSNQKNKIQWVSKRSGGKVIL